jgi:pimeloyl-ACP methyl ester carboxylesterase
LRRTDKKYWLIVGLLSILFLFSPPRTVRAGTLASRFEASPCPFDIPPQETLECGYLIVPENRSRPNSPDIRIFVTVVKSHSPTPAPDPIILLRGGLGSPTQRFVERELSRYEAWLAKRDLIVFDQRGLGHSQPNLTCPEVHQSILQVFLGTNPTLDQQLAPRLACRDQWLKQGLDLAAYNTFETATDVADLWRVLGYEQVNLLGASYWTIVGQLLLRDYGDTGQIRSVVLDSPV